MHALAAHAEVADDVSRGALGDGDERRHATGDAGLHAGEAVPAPQRQLAQQRGCRGDLVPAVDRDGVVDSGDQGQADAAEAEEAVAERLVVVHDVEVAAALGQGLCGADRERQRLGEATRPHRRDLESVDQAPELAEPGGPERVLVPVEVEAGQRPQDRARMPAD